MTPATRPQSPGEEIANSVSHGVGLLASLVAVPLLLAAALRRDGLFDIVGASVFAATIVLLYAASTLYHALPNGKAKRVSRVVDHGAVFLLIAGTYTPFTLGALRGPWGWTLLGLVWSLAVFGIVLTALAGFRYPRLATGVYLGMGWLMIIAIKPLWMDVPLNGVLWLLAGGVAYTAGVAFLSAGRMRYSHFVWHLFVLAGSTCHYIAVLRYATPSIKDSTVLNTNGYAALAANAPLVPYSFTRREPGEYDVLIDIHYCGICHSDIHQARAEWDESIFPMVPGHEIAGVVARVGAKVTRHKVGDHVGVGCFVDSCRTCVPCRHGLEQYCTVHTVFTYNGREADGTPTMGGYSDKIVVDENYVLRMPGNLPLDAAAPLLCAGITLYSPLRHWHAGPGRQIAILGLGGLGHMGVKLAHAMGAEVAVLSHSLRKALDAKRLGADDFHSTSDPDTFLKLQGHFDLIVNTVSAEIDWNRYLDLLAVDGSMVVVGLPGAPVPIKAMSVVKSRRSLSGSSNGGIQETQEMLDFCGAHHISCDIERTAIQGVNDAYERVLKSDVRYRFVIDMASLS